MAMLSFPEGGGAGGLTWSKITSSTTAVKDNGYLLSASANLTLTLPASPAEGDTVGVADADGMATTWTLTIARNGSNIRGLAEDITIDVNYAGFVLVYSDSTQGWVITTEISGSGSLAWNTVTSSTNATSGNGYLIVAGANTTITLPASPVAGDTIGIVDAGSKATTYTLTVARNGNNIQGDASDLTIDTDRSGFTLSYADATNGWVIVSELTLGDGSEASSSNAYLGWTLENDVTTDQTPTISDSGQMFRFTSATAADRNLTLPSVGTTEDGNIFWIANESSYVITVKPSDSDFIWNSGAGYGVEMLGGTTICIRYDHSATKWEIINKSGGMVRLEGLKLHLPCETITLYNNSLTNNMVPDKAERNRGYTNGPVSVDNAAKFGINKYSFNGSTTWITVNDSPDWDVFGSTSGDYTVACWVYCDNAASVDENFITHYEDIGNIWFIRRTSTGTLQLYYDGSAGTEINISGGTISQSTWHHVALVKIGSESGIYIDGSQVAYDATFTPDTFIGDLYLGRRGDSANYLTGDLDDIIIAAQNIYNAAPVVGNTDTLSNWNKPFVGVQ